MIERVAVLAPEPIRARMAGMGIRALELARALSGRFDVRLIVPNDPGEAREIAGPIRIDVRGAAPGALAEAARGVQAAVVSGHAANGWFHEVPDLPVAADLYDPFPIENLHYARLLGPETALHDRRTLELALSRADVFLCASAEQRLFYAGALFACGRVGAGNFPDDPALASLLVVVPFGAPPEEARGDRAAGRAAAGVLAEGPLVLFGGIYDWYDPILAIEAVAVARRELPGMTLTFTHHPNPGLTPQGKRAEAMEHVQRRGFDFVRFEPWVAYDRRGEFFDRFALALLTFPQSIETDLSMRTRVYDYLWGGLPIVTSSAPGTDEIVTRYGAGAIVHSESVTDFAREIVRAVRENEAMTAGTTTFALQHQWSRTLQPLVDFVREPQADLTKETFAATPQLPERRPSFFRRLQRRALAFRRVTESGKWSAR